VDLGPVKTPWEAVAKIALSWASNLLFLGSGILIWVGGLRVIVWPFVAGAFAAMFFTGALGRRATIKRLAALRDIEYRVCPWRSYDLRALEPSGVCPECGKAFDPEALGREWRSRLEPAVRF
jgi:hypothetical protein